MNASQQKELAAQFSPEDWAWLNRQAVFTAARDYHVAQILARHLLGGRDKPLGNEPLPADLEIPEAELDMALEELHGPDTKMDAEERIARLTRRVAYLQQAVAHAVESAVLDGPGASDAASGVVETRRAELAEAQRQLAALSQRN